MQYVGIAPDSRYFQVSLFYFSLTRVVFWGNIRHWNSVTNRNIIDRCKDRCLVGIRLINM